MPALLVVGMIPIAGPWAFGAIPWWLAVGLLLFGAGALASVVSRNPADP
jgi:hypothetical protein